MNFLGELGLALALEIRLQLRTLEQQRSRRQANGLWKVRVSAQAVKGLATDVQLAGGG